jgi:hypothetical protein
VKAGDEMFFNGKKFTLLYEHFRGVWMACETDNPKAKPRLLLAQDLKEPDHARS